jgi:hypothetical protein
MREHEDEDGASGRYVVVKALEDGVVIMGLTRGPELTAAIKIRGRAEILTDVGRVESGS